VRYYAVRHVAPCKLGLLALEKRQRGGSMWGSKETGHRMRMSVGDGQMLF